MKFFIAIFALLCVSVVFSSERSLSCTSSANAASTASSSPQEEHTHATDPLSESIKDAVPLKDWTPAILIAGIGATLGIIVLSKFF